MTKDEVVVSDQHLGVFRNIVTEIVDLFQNGGVFSVRTIQRVLLIEGLLVGTMSTERVCV